MALIFMSGAVVTLAGYTIFDSELSPTQIEAMKSWIPFFSTILLTIYGFYFGSRGLEKCVAIYEGKKQKRVERDTRHLEPKG